MRHSGMIVLALVLGMGQPVFAAAPSTTETKTQQPTKQAKIAVVRIGNREVFRLAPAGGLTAEQRGKDANAAILSALAPPAGTTTVKAISLPDDVTVQSVNGRSVVAFKGKNIITVTTADTKATGESADVLANQWAQNLRDGLAGLNITDRTAYSAIKNDFSVAATPSSETTASAADAQLAVRIRQRLESDTGLRKQGVNIQVKNGNVILTGVVRDRQTADRIVDTVKNTRGVSKVRSDLRIEGK